MSWINDLIGFDLFPFTDSNPPWVPSMKYDGNERFIGDEITVRGKQYVIKEIDGRHVIVAPADTYLAEEIRRRLNDGDGA